MPSQYSYQENLLVLESHQVEESVAEKFGFHEPPKSGVCRSLATVSTPMDLVAADKIARESTPPSRPAPLRINSSSNLGQLTGVEYDESSFELNDEISRVFPGLGLNRIKELFDTHRIPMGMLAKLSELDDYDFDFVIDDSGSTNELSDVKKEMAHPKIKPLVDGTHLTRFQEIESRIHYLVDFLASYRNVKLKFTFLNHNSNHNGSDQRPGQKLHLPRAQRPSLVGLPPADRESGKNFELDNREGSLDTEAYATMLHDEVRRRFSFTPIYATPIYKVLGDSLELAAELLQRDQRKTHLCLLTDGVPSDVPIREPRYQELFRNYLENNPGQALDEDTKKILVLADLVNEKRGDPSQCPITLFSCSNRDEDVEWLKKLEEILAYCSEIDDFGDELKEVLKDQGPAFPFTFGFWLITQLCAALNPNDLDKLDENIPFTKKSLEKLMGRELSLNEYRYYFALNPHAKLYLDLQEQFEQSPKTGASLVAAVRHSREETAGYVINRVTNKNELPIDGDKGGLYAYLPLSRHTYTKLYQPHREAEIQAAHRAHAEYQQACMAVQPAACCGFWSSSKPELPPKPAPIPSAYMDLADYQAYFDNHPFVQQMAEKNPAYKASLFHALSAENPEHAHQVVDLVSLERNVQGSQMMADRAVTREVEQRLNRLQTSTHHNQVQVEIPGGFELPRRSGGMS